MALTHDIVMPTLSDTMEEGVILRWMVGVGQEVEVGTPLLEIETDKVTTFYECDVAGTVSGILADEGDVVPVGTVIAHIQGP